MRAQKREPGFGLSSIGRVGDGREEPLVRVDRDGVLPRPISRLSDVVEELGPAAQIKAR